MGLCMTGDGSIGRALATIEPPPRLVDWSLLAFVLVEVVTGLLSFTDGRPAGWPLFWIHRIAGLAIIVLLGFKLARVRHRLANPSHWDPTFVFSILTAIMAFGALITGIVWVFGLDIRLSYWTLLSVHVGLGLVLLPLVLLHLRSRFRLPRRHDFEGRRTALQYTGLLVGGALAYRGQETLNRVLNSSGANRRFTGSQPREGAGNSGFPVTSWVADDPPPLDRHAYRLTITGHVDEPIELGITDLEIGDDQEALLDCTSGWYTIQRWSGIRVGALIDAAGGLTDQANWVRFVSVTGYRWSLPIDEAQHALLATHVGGEPLSHGHGAPARLVAPGRRGFQWVKWVDRVEVRSTPDPAQWFVTLISGFR